MQCNSCTYISKALSLHIAIAILHSMSKRKKKHYTLPHGNLKDVMIKILRMEILRVV